MGLHLLGHGDDPVADQLDSDRIDAGGLFATHPQLQKSVPSSIRKRASTILWVSDAPSTSRAWRGNAPGTIDQALDALWEKAGAAPPLSDLVYSDPYARLAPKIISGSYVGLHDVGGVMCHHLFLAQETVDWQLWVDAGERPLPRRLVITYRQLPQAPVFAADFGEWDFTPSLATDAFSFEPPEGAIAVEAVTTSITGRGYGERR